MLMWFPQVSVEQHGSARQGPLEKLHHGAVDNCEWCWQLMSVVLLYAWHVQCDPTFHVYVSIFHLGHISHLGGGESHQRCPLTDCGGDDQKRVAAALARYAERDGNPHFLWGMWSLSVWSTFVASVNSRIVSKVFIGHTWSDHHTAPNCSLRLPQAAGSNLTTRPPAAPTVIVTLSKVWEEDEVSLLHFSVVYLYCSYLEWPCASWAL